MILTILACLILIIPKCTVESCKLTELITLELVLTLGDGGGLVFISQQTFQDCVVVTCSFNDVVNELLRLVDLLFGVGHDQAM